MKPFSFLKISASVVAFVAMVASSSLQAATPGDAPIKGKAEVKAVVGQANVKLGQILQEGDTITTGPEGYVELWLGDNGQMVRVDKDSSLTLDELVILKKTADGADFKTTLNLKKGGLVGEAKKISAASKYEVKHAQGVAGIRGTEYAVLPNKGVVCTKGTVVVTFMVNGVPSAPITLGPNQVALPPAQPGGVPRIVTVSPEVADALNAIAEAFQNLRRNQRGPFVRGRDVEVVVSAFAEADSGTPTLREHNE